MKKVLCLILLFITTFAYSQTETDTAKVPFKFSGTISITNNGTAPIPVFSLGKPAFLANFSIFKKRFSYDPDMAYGFNGKPWYIDNWFHYKLIEQPKFELRTGINANLFFSVYDTPEGEIMKVLRHGSFELASTYKLSSKSSLGLVYWYAKGFDKGTIGGHFINLIANKSFNLSNQLIFDVTSQFFYTNNTGNMDGLFISGRFALSHTQTHLSLYTQETQTLTSNMTPNPGFKWYYGVAYTF
jgi:hypothetical protein